MPTKNINMDRIYAEQIDGKFVGLKESEIPASDRKGEKVNIVVEPFELSQVALSAAGIIRNPTGRHVAEPGEIEPKWGVIPGSSGSGKHVKH
jgi:hypothetical protein